VTLPGSDVDGIRPVGGTTLLGGVIPVGGVRLPDAAVAPGASLVALGAEPDAAGPDPAFSRVADASGRSWHAVAASATAAMTIPARSHPIERLASIPMRERL